MRRVSNHLSVPVCSLLFLWLCLFGVSPTRAMDSHDGSNLDNKQKPLANDESFSPESLSENQASIDSLAEQELVGNDYAQSLQKLMHDPDRWHIHSTDSGPKVKFEFLRLPSENPDSLINAIRFSPDGKYIAIGAMNAAYIYDVETGDKTCTLRHNSTEDTSKMLLVRGVAFTADSKKLITACEDSLIRVWGSKKNAVAALADRWRSAGLGHCISHCEQHVLRP